MLLLKHTIGQLGGLIAKKSNLPLVMNTRGAAGRWRELNGLPRRFASPCPLADNPEWSYADGRGPAPLNKGQKKRYIQNKHFAEDIIRMVKQQNRAKSFPASLKASGATQLADS